MGRANKPTDVFKHVDMTGGLDACWPWKLESNNEGRPYFTIKGKKFIAYRLVYELVKGVVLTPDVMLLHSCDNSICCNPNHLRPGEHVENMDDMKVRGRAGLSHHMVNVIKRMLDQKNEDGSAKFTHQQIADATGTARTTVTSYATGHRKEHV